MVTDLGSLIRRLAGLLAAAAVVLGLPLLAGCGASAPPVERPAVSAGATVDADSGLPIIGEDQLPVAARQTLQLIDAGGPFPYEEDGSTFSNREGILPDEAEGFYREYTVRTPGEDDRGARRIVTGAEDTIFYYTDDHYSSFSRIQRG